MSTLLKIDVSPRSGHSVSRRLGDEFAAAWLKKHKDSKVIERDLAKSALPFLDMPWITGAYTPAEKHSEEQKASLQVSDELVDELLAADEVVITTPMYNFAPPAALKAWIDHVVRLGRTFTAKYEGLAKGRKVTVIVASGGSYAKGSGMEQMDFMTGYLKFIFGFMGITDVDVRFAYGTSAVAAGKVSLEEFVRGQAPAVAAA